MTPFLKTNRGKVWTAGANDDSGFPWLLDFRSGEVFFGHRDYLDSSTRGFAVRFRN